MLKKSTIILAFVIISQLLGAKVIAEGLNDRVMTNINIPLIELEYGYNTLKIALIDTGIHNNNNRLDNTKIGLGYNYAFNKPETDDVIGHGTRIAGIIQETLGRYNKKLDYILVPLVYYSKFPLGVPVNGGVKAITKALYDAVDVYGCNVINISSGITSDNEELKKAVQYAEKKGVIVVAAVGNEHSFNKDRLLYPAAYDTVIGVGAVDSNLNVTSFSQRNSSVMVTAPGQEIFTVSIKAGTVTDKVSGTSYAAAYVSSYAAILLSKFPAITPKEFREMLKHSCKDLGDKGYDEVFGYGFIDISAGVDFFSLLKFH